MDRITELLNENKTLAAQLTRERIGHAFSGSKFIAEKLAIPADLVEASFAKHFAIENGRITATHPETGLPILNPVNGAVADFDVALEAIVAAYPHRDKILRPSGSPTGSSVRTMTRGEFQALRPTDQRDAAGRFRIVD